MQFPAREVRLKDGRSALLRGVCVEDAAELLDCLKITAKETPYLVLESTEYGRTVAQEQEFLRGPIGDPRGGLIVPEVEGALAGIGSLHGVAPFARHAHRCTVGVTLYREYWGLGLGRVVMELLMELAKRADYEQAELEVVAGNARAIALYESLGFACYGRRRCDLKYSDGSYADMLLMAKEL